MRFQLYETHTSTVTGIKSGKNPNIGSLWPFRDINVTLKLKLQTSNVSDTNITNGIYI